MPFLTFLAADNGAQMSCFDVGQTFARGNSLCMWNCSHSWQTFKIFVMDHTHYARWLPVHVAAGILRSIYPQRVHARTFVYGKPTQVLIHDNIVILWLRVVGLLASQIIQQVSDARCWSNRNQLFGPWLWGSFKKVKRQRKPLATRSNPSLPKFCSWKK